MDIQQVSSTKNRIARGKCPCCHKDFKDLHEHMAAQHPTYATPEPAK